MPLETADLEALMRLYLWAHSRNLDFRVLHTHENDRWRVAVDRPHESEGRISGEYDALQTAIERLIRSQDRDSAAR